MTDRYLLEGDPMSPSSTDLIAETVYLPIKELPNGYDDTRVDETSGWRIMTGNTRFNLWARVAYRYEIEEPLTGDE